MMKRVTKDMYLKAKKQGKSVKRTKRGYWLLKARDKVA